ncbi:MAG: hypothetical protein AABM67_03930 [Acidobacteriota bacterium]
MKKFWIVACILVFVLCAFGFVSGRKTMSAVVAGVLSSKARTQIVSKVGDMSPEFTAKPNANPIGQRSQVRVEQLTLWRTGFKPAEITRPKGAFVLIVVNNSRVRDISLQLNREAGNNLREVHLPPSKREWRELLDLPPGRYVITEANHSDWVCSLNITPR